MQTSTTPRDMDRIRSLTGDLVLHPEALPISFRYGGRLYTGLPAGTGESRFLDANIVETRFTARLDDDVRILAEIETYRDHPAVEWTVWFENTGGRTSGLLEDVRAADLLFGGSGARVITNNGDICSAESYTNACTDLTPGTAVEQAPRGGRPCDGAFPYQRVLFDGYGVSVAIGWPGQWRSVWTGVEEGARLVCGQEFVHTVLEPGERFRTPRMALVAFEGDLERGVNVWRRWYHAHVLPRVSGEMAPCMVHTSDNGGGIEWTSATEEQQTAALRRTFEAQPWAELWWVDAGWYPCETDGGNSWWQTGSWYPDPKRFPRGLAPIGEACREAGLRFLVWFEPERVRYGSWLAESHPEWLLHKSGESTEDPDKANMLLDLANPDCLRWLCEHISGLIRSSHITVYRQDFNFQPLPYWRGNEPDHRGGMLENQYIQGYLAYWDYLLLHDPGLMIDSCASGGRRNDLETMRRAVPFHQTDFGYGHHPVKQKFSQLLYSWIPYFRGFDDSWDDAEGKYIVPDYYAPPARPSHEAFDMLSTIAPVMTVTNAAVIGDRPELLERQRKIAALCKRARRHLRDDFYPLTPQHCDRARWSAWQFYSPERGDGILQFFRNNAAPEASLTVRLRGLRPEAVYRFENGMTGETLELTGASAMDEGFTERLEKREASLWIYETVR